jgi:hypothetical protein
MTYEIAKRHRDDGYGTLNTLTLLAADTFGSARRRAERDGIDAGDYVEFVSDRALRFVGGPTEDDDRNMCEKQLELMGLNGELRREGIITARHLPLPKRTVISSEPADVAGRFCSNTRAVSQAPCRNLFRAQAVARVTDVGRSLASKKPKYDSRWSSSRRAIPMCPPFARRRGRVSTPAGLL